MTACESIKASREYAEELRKLTDLQLLDKVLSKTPRPFEPRFNKAAIELKELERRGL